MGIKGIVWSASALAILLNEGIGDTIRVSLTPRPGGDRREEVYAACEILQALGLRSFAPSITACPGCGRTTSSTFQELAERVQDYVRAMMPDLEGDPSRRRDHDRRRHGLRRQRSRRIEGRQHRHLAAGHGRIAELSGLHRRRHATTLRGTYDELAIAFQALVDDYVDTRYPEPSRLRAQGLGLETFGP